MVSPWGLLAKIYYFLSRDKIICVGRAGPTTNIEGTIPLVFIMTGEVHHHGTGRYNGDTVLAKGARGLSSIY